MSWQRNFELEIDWHCQQMPMVELRHAGDTRLIGQAEGTHVVVMLLDEGTCWPRALRSAVGFWPSRAVALGQITSTLGVTFACRGSPR